MPALVSPRVVRVPGWTGGVREALEPGGWTPSAGGVIDDGANLAPYRGDRLTVRGGSRVLRTFAAHAITQVLGVWPFSATGAVVIAYSATEQRHYAYALTDAMGWAFGQASGTPDGTEAASTVALGAGWETPTPGRPQAVELFETLYLVDAAADGAHRPLVALTVVGGALTATTPTAFDGSPLRPAAAASFNSHLFVAGYDSASAPNAGSAPHMLRHSFLGRNPAAANGFDVDAYAIVGAQGQPVRAMAPGNSLLLVAKEAELYRITGTGRAVEGWQFAIAQLDTTLGVGCTNAAALAHVAGMWYGVGRAGPFRTNGTTVESLVDGRRRSWSRVDTLETAVVTVHPDRGVVLFGLHEPGTAGRSPGAPTTWWVWDLTRDCWQPSWHLGRSLHAAAAVASGQRGGPAGALTVPVQRFSGVGDDFDTATCAFTLGDPAAETEVWARDVEDAAATSDVLATVCAPGVRQVAVPLASARATVVRLRARKAGTFGPYTDEVAMQRGWWARARSRAEGVSVASPDSGGGGGGTTGGLTSGSWVGAPGGGASGGGTP